MPKVLSFFVSARMKLIWLVKTRTRRPRRPKIRAAFMRFDSIFEYWLISISERTRNIEGQQVEDRPSLS